MRTSTDPRNRFAHLLLALTVCAAVCGDPLVPAPAAAQSSDLATWQPFYQRRGAERTQVAFELINNRPVFRVRLNGSDKVFRFILDTGAGMTVVSTNTAARLNLKRLGRGGQGTAVGGTFEKIYGLLWSCEIGDVRLDNVPVLIRPFTNESSPVDGYLGLSFIAQFVTSLDYGARTLVLERPMKRERLPGLPNEISVKATSIGLLTREVRVEGIDGSLNFIVDTAASVSVLARELETAPGMSLCRRGEKLDVNGAAGVEEDVKTIFLTRLTLGPSQREDILAAVLNLDQISEAAGSPQMGIVGGNFLRHFRVVFDVPRRVVSLFPLSEKAEAWPNGRSSEFKL